MQQGQGKAGEDGIQRTGKSVDVRWDVRHLEIRV